MPQTEPHVRKAPAGERRQITVLFADMVGFTGMSERLGEERTFHLIRRVNDAMAEALAEHGGLVKDFTGDGLMAVFGVPVAFEDGPLRACRASLAIHERLRGMEAAIADEYGVRPQMRIGLNSGLAVVTQVRAETTAIGDTVNLASRLQSLASPGTTALSESTFRRVQGLVNVEFVGAHAIKGKADPQRVYRLDGILPDATRFKAAISSGLGQFVGRALELTTLDRC